MDTIIVNFVEYMMRHDDVKVVDCIPHKTEDIINITVNTVNDPQINDDVIHDYVSDALEALGVSFLDIDICGEEDDMTTYYGTIVLGY